LFWAFWPFCWRGKWRWVPFWISCPCCWHSDELSLYC
jgi:hypothetical protein